jgi:hypothetical protein
MSDVSQLCYEQAVSSDCFSQYMKMHDICVLHPESIVMWRCGYRKIAVSGEELFAYEDQLMEWGGSFATLSCSWSEEEEVEAIVLSDKQYWKCLQLFQ